MGAIDELRGAGFRVSLIGNDGIKIEPARYLTGELRDLTRRNKPAIVAALVHQFAMQDEASSEAGMEVADNASDAEADRVESIRAALADHDSAPPSHLAIDAESSLCLDTDDRRTCDQCGNLRAGVCTVAGPGGIVDASKGYKPSAIFRDTPHRCAGYVGRDEQATE